MWLKLNKLGWIDLRFKLKLHVEQVEFSFVSELFRKLVSLGLLTVHFLYEMKFGTGSGWPVWTFMNLTFQVQSEPSRPGLSSYYRLRAVVIQKSSKFWMHSLGIATEKLWTESAPPALERDRIQTRMRPNSNFIFLLLSSLTDKCRRQTWK